MIMKAHPCSSLQFHGIPLLSSGAEQRHLDGCNIPKHYVPMSGFERLADRWWRGASVLMLSALCYVAAFILTAVPIYLAVDLGGRGPVPGWVYWTAAALVAPWFAGPVTHLRHLRAICARAEEAERRSKLSGVS